MPDIKLTMQIHHDATDPDANDTTMDMNDAIIENFFKDLDGFEIHEQGRQSLTVSFWVPCENPSMFHVED